MESRWLSISLKQALYAMFCLFVLASGMSIHVGCPSNVLPSTSITTTTMINGTLSTSGIQTSTLFGDYGPAPDWFNTGYGWFSIAVSPDGSRVFASSFASISCFSRTGTFLWSKWFAYEELPYLLVSGDNSYLFAAGFRTFQSYSLTGGLLWTFDPAHPSPGIAASWWLPRISADSSTIAAVSLDGYVKVLDRSGSLLWQTTVSAGSIPPSLAISGDGNIVLIGTQNHVYAYSITGESLWSYGPFEDNVVFVSMSNDARVIVVKTARMDIYCFDAQGSLKWHKLPYDPSYWVMLGSADYWLELVDVSPEGSRVFTVRTTLEEGELHGRYCCFDDEGTELWTSDIREGSPTLVFVLRCSADRIIFAASGWGGYVRLLGPSGHQVVSHEVPWPFMKAVSLSSHRETIAACGVKTEGSQDILYVACWFSRVALRRLTYNSVPESGPCISGDGQWAAFISGSGSSAELYVISRDGTSLKRLTYNSVPESSPSISGDGQWIAFISGSGTSAELYVISRDGSSLRHLTYNSVPESSPSISGDGQWIAFISGTDSSAELYVIKPDRTALKRLTYNLVPESSPSISYDGYWIAFISRSDTSAELYVISRDATILRRLTYNSVAESSPSISGDGQWIAFINNVGSSAELYVIKADRTSLKRLTYNSVPESNPWISGDGQWIAFISGSDASAELYVMTRDGTSLKRLTYDSVPESCPSMSGDGQWVAFVLGTGSSAEFWANSRTLILT